MTGSNLAPIVIPIAVSIGLAAWLVMVYHAASHPTWKHHSATREPAPLVPSRHGDRHLKAARTGATPAGLAGDPPGPGSDRTGKPQVPHAA